MTTPSSPPKRSAPLQPGRVALPLPTVKAVRPSRFTAFIYGYSGSGKSYMLRSLVASATLFPALVLVCDAGHATYQDLIDDEKFMVVETATMAAAAQMVDWLVKTPNHGFRTLAIDNLSELHRSALLEAARSRVQDKGRGTAHVLEQADYGIARLQLLSLLSDATLKMPGVNFIATASAAETADELSGLNYIQPNLSGKLGTEVPGFFDVCGYLYMKTPSAAERREAEKAGKTLAPSRILVTSQTSTILQARNRGGKLGTEVKDPTFPKIFSLFTSAS